MGSPVSRGWVGSVVSALRCLFPGTAGPLACALRPLHPPLHPCRVRTSLKAAGSGRPGQNTVPKVLSTASVRRPPRSTPLTLGGQLFAGRLAAGGLAGGLLSAGHGCVPPEWRVGVCRTRTRVVMVRRVTRTRQWWLKTEIKRTVLREMPPCILGPERTQTRDHTLGWQHRRQGIAHPTARLATPLQIAQHNVEEGCGAGWRGRGTHTNGPASAAAVPECARVPGAHRQHF